MLSYIILYHYMLYYILVYYIIVYYIIIYYIISLYIILYHYILYYIILFLSYYTITFIQWLRRCRRPQIFDFPTEHKTLEGPRPISARHGRGYTGKALPGPGRLSCACPASPCCAWAATGGVERVILAGSLDVVLGLPVELRQKGGAIQAWRDPNALS